MNSQDNNLRESKAIGLTEDAEEAIKIIEGFFRDDEKRKSLQETLDSEWRELQGSKAAPAISDSYNNSSAALNLEEAPMIPDLSKGLPEDVLEKEPPLIDDNESQEAPAKDIAEEVAEEPKESEEPAETPAEDPTNEPAEEPSIEATSDERSIEVEGEDTKVDKAKVDGVEVISTEKKEGMALPILVSILVVVLIASILFLTGCGAGSGNSAGALDEFPASDMSGYNGLSNYEGELAFVDVTVDDVKNLMDSKASFVLYAGYANCPWCNALISYLNDAAVAAGEKIAYIDTRRDPSWVSNLDIEGYDTFVEYFGEHLEIDDEGKPHLYVPDVYFVKNGAVVARHEGVTPGLNNPTDALTEQQKQELSDKLKEEFSSVRG